MKQKPEPQSQNEIDFLFNLRCLLSQYDVDIVAVDDGASYGQQLPLIRIEFNQPY